MDVFVARQPIFDRQSQVHAYELLYRAHAGCDQYTGTDEDSTTLEVIAGSLLTIGLNSIAAGKKVFINFGRNLLVDGLISMLPKERVVIEVLETIEPDDEVLKSCRKLRNLGYTIVLDDFEWHPRFEELIEVAHMMKIDMRLTSREEQQRLVTTYRPRGIEMLAEKVETREEYEWAASIGYDYFQGYFFARPAIISGTEIQPVVATCLQLLRQLQSPEMDFKKLEAVIAKDVALTYKLFRYVNSVLFAHRGNIDSIRRALMELGEDGIRRWVTIASLPRLAKNKPEELVACALVRARFSENLARLSGDPGYPSAYLTGLFSMLDALLDRPLEQALDEVGLEPQLNCVLLGKAPADQSLVKIHALARAYEAGEWEETRKLALGLGLTDEIVGGAYVDATAWTDEILRGHQPSPAAAPAKAESVVPKRERRRHRRDTIGGAIAVLWGTSSQEERVTQAHLSDVSAFGAKFMMAARIPPGSWLMFNHHKAGISGRGTVRYCRMIKSSYEVGVEFAGGTGWKGASNAFGAHLRNLNGAIDRLQTASGSTEAVHQALASR
jgi:EAL and modified HD-GYP domain-containing signal transduction protein